MSRLARPPLLLAAALAVTAAAVPAVAAPGHGAGKVACFGKAPTVFSSKNGAHLVGTAHGDVIEATGSGVTVSAGGGNDRVCVKGAKKVDAGAGDDRVQLVSGSVVGGAGKDVVKVLSGSGSVKVDGGAGPNTFSVPSSRLAATAITYHSGDVINGAFARVDAPAGAPSFDLTYAGQAGPTVSVTETQVVTTFSPGSCCNNVLLIGKPLPANGRSLVAWSISWGDGTAPMTGLGSPPTGQLVHYFIAPGVHPITVSVTDSLGSTTTKTITADIAFSSKVSMLETSGNPATSPDKTFTITPTVGTGDQIASWYLDYGDGTTDQGSGAPPATKSHTYVQAGHFTPYIYVFTAHGATANGHVSTTYGPDSNPHVSFALYKSAIVIGPQPGHLASFSVTGPAAQNVLVGQSLYVDAGGSYAVDSIDIDWGDGQIDLANGSGSHVYLGPGSRTIRVIGHASGHPDVVATVPVTVRSGPTHAELFAPSTVPEGPVTFHTAGQAVPPGANAIWFLSFGDGSLSVSGVGLPPATITHTYVGGYYRASLQLVTSEGTSDYAYVDVNVTSPEPHVNYFGDETGGWIAAVQAPDATGSGAVFFSGDVVASTGGRISGATVTFGDGAAQAVPAVADGDFGSRDVVHGYTATGEYTAALTAKDSFGRAVTATEHISVAGKPNATLPATGTATHGVAFALPLTAVTPGANANVLGYDIRWGDTASAANPDSFGYGAVPPAALVHTYSAAGSRTVTVTIFTDHGQVKTLTETVTVA